MLRHAYGHMLGQPHTRMCKHLYTSLSSAKTHRFTWTSSDFRQNRHIFKKAGQCVMHNEEWDNTTVCKHIYLTTQNESGPKCDRDKRCMHACSVIPVDAHTLPGLRHSAAVAAAAPRAPAQPQLLLRLTPIEVVCEFSETRHLPPWLLTCRTWGFSAL